MILVHGTSGDSDKLCNIFIQVHIYKAMSDVEDLPLLHTRAHTYEHLCWWDFFANESYDTQNCSLVAGQAPVQPSITSFQYISTYNQLIQIKPFFKSSLFEQSGWNKERKNNKNMTSATTHFCI